MINQRRGWGLGAGGWQLPSPQLLAPNPQPGFTLIELLIGIGVTVIIVFILAGTVTSVFDALQREHERQELLDGTRRATDTISELAQAAVAVLPTFLSTEPATYTTDTDTVVLTLPAENVDGYIISTVYDTIVVSRDGSDPSELWIKTFPAPGSRRVAGTRTPTEHLTDLRIRYFAPDADGDGDDEEITSSLLYPTATRLDVTIEAEVIPVKNQPITVDLVGGGRLRNAP